MSNLSTKMTSEDDWWNVEIDRTNCNLSLDEFNEIVINFSIYRDNTILKKKT